MFWLSSVQDKQKLAHKAAAQGHGDAQYSLAMMLASGRCVPKNPAQAARWVRLSANQGHTQAQYQLALAYVKGKSIPKTPQPPNSGSR